MTPNSTPAPGSSPEGPGPILVLEVVGWGAVVETGAEICCCSKVAAGAIAVKRTVLPAEATSTVPVDNPIAATAAQAAEWSAHQ